jgi:hypothetical protein
LVKGFGLLRENGLDAARRCLKNRSQAGPDQRRVCCAATELSAEPPFIAFYK